MNRHRAAAVRNWFPQWDINRDRFVSLVALFVWGAIAMLSLMVYILLPSFRHSYPISIYPVENLAPASGSVLFCEDAHSLEECLAVKPHIQCVWCRDSRSTTTDGCHGDLIRSSQTLRCVGSNETATTILRIECHRHAGVLWTMRMLFLGLSFVAGVALWVVTEKLWSLLDKASYELIKGVLVGLVLGFWTMCVAIWCSGRGVTICLGE